LPFFPTKGGLFVKKGSPIRSFSQLNGKRVGVISKSFFDNYVRKNLPEVESVPIKTSAELVIAADQGNVDAFVADYPTLMYQSGIMGKRNSFEVVEYAADQEYRAAIAEGNTPMLVMVESGLSLIDDSERQTILSRWIIGEDEDSMDWLMPVIFLTGCSVFIALLVPFLFSIQRRRKS